MIKLNFESISIEITKQCNLACSYCYAKASNHESSMLSTSLLLDFFPRFRDSGGRRVLLTGGEALLCKDIKEIIDHAVSCGLLVDLFTNGTLITEEMAEFLAEKINLINVSLDGPEAHHDLCRGKKGSFQNTVRALKLLQKYNARIAIQCMVTPMNIDKMSWIYEISNICSPIFIKLGHVSAMGRGVLVPDLYLKELFTIKELAQLYLEKYNHFHTRIITNVISKEELKIFYTDFDYLVTPWMFSDGTIHTCYVDDYLDYWELTDICEYPYTSEMQYQKRKRLIDMAHMAAEKAEYFDLLQLLSDVAKEIATNDHH